MPTISGAEIIKQEKLSEVIIKGLAAELDVTVIAKSVTEVLEARGLEGMSHWVVRRWINDNEDLVSQLVHRERIRIILTDWKVYKQHIFGMRYKEIRRIEAVILDLMDELKKLGGIDKVKAHNAYRTVGILIGKKHEMLRALGDFDKKAKLPKKVAEDQSVIKDVGDKTKDVDDFADLIGKVDVESRGNAMDKEADVFVEEGTDKLLEDAAKDEFDATTKAAGKDSVPPKDGEE